MQRFICILLALLLTGGAMNACSREKTPPENIDASDVNPDTTTAEALPDYNWSDDFGGKPFRFLNAEDIYAMHSFIDPEEQTGETLNDAQFFTCSTLEEKLNLVIEETNVLLGDLNTEITKVVLAGEDVYDMVFVRADNLAAAVEQEMLYDLQAFDEIQLDKPWWMQNYNKQIMRGDALYAAEGYAHLMAIDSLNVMYMNEDMITDLGMELPYQLVRDGKWTLDALGKYAKAGASLNGDNTFTWKDDGKCVFGLSLSNSAQGVQFMLFGANEQLVEVQNGKLTMTAGSSRFYDAVSKIVSVFPTGDGTVFYGNTSGSDDDPGHWIYAFEHERAMFMLTELCKTARMRDKAYTFGILPLAKYDENQENYVTATFSANPLVAIPVTASDPHLSAVASDALSYLSYKNVYPAFREVTLEQKGLRNEDSIDMLEIIMQNTVPQQMAVFGLLSSTTLEESIRNIVMSGSDAVASAIESNRSVIEEQLKKING